MTYTWWRTVVICVRLILCAVYLPVSQTQCWFPISFFTVHSDNTWASPDLWLCVLPGRRCVLLRVIVSDRPQPCFRGAHARWTQVWLTLAFSIWQWGQYQAKTGNVALLTSPHPSFPFVSTWLFLYCLQNVSITPCILKPHLALRHFPFCTFSLHILHFHPLSFSNIEPTAWLQLTSVSKSRNTNFTGS